MTMLPTYFPSPSQGVWHLGPLPIRAYALFIITGIIAALIIGDRRWAARGGQRGVIYDIALWTVPFGLIGGRLYHLATDWRTYWGPGGAGLSAATRIWDGGLGIWGAVALGLLGAWIGCRRHGVPLPAFIDALAPGIILAQAIGRLGNYFNQELYGRETTVPWGLEIFYRRDPSGFIDPHSLDGVSTGQLAVIVQPTFLYELLWNLLVFVALLYIDKRFTMGHGRLFASYVALYCIGRFWVELLRDDTATHIAGIRINTFTSTFVFIGAVVYIMAAPKGREDPESLHGKDDAADDESDSEVKPAKEPAKVAAASAATAAAPVVADKDDGPPDSGDTAEAVDAVDAEDVEAEESEAEEPEADEPEAEESEAEALDAEAEEAEESEAEEPEELEEPEAAVDEAAEIEEPEAEEEAEAEAAAPEADEPEAEALDAEVEEAEESEAEEPEELEAAVDEGEADEEPETEEPEADEAAEIEEPEAEDEAEEAEVEEADEPETAEETEAEAEDDAAADDAAQDESAAPPAASTPSPAAPDTQPRRRWPFRRRNGR
ncbi:Prolipoprotein diacylglyceryltransferase [Mycobacterium rhizamassiliense]|uniref:Phosphatidylglycerol--prolipoprotein diacylglyceryl transferase n=1 Tax=Mycobacterium rhizamassiliense TaxID=1841860 RepID=A0A2U3NZQ3_9MYCO|nr:prolipoprotein diacylglyceryl transferase [Mycobacterium rhizamassiliense]SPM36990.1 Prolipoprotein diacylglyceryltransferase [Mycobacterium rhizamassiliense]